MDNARRSLVLRKETSGESFLKLHLLSPEDGIQLCLKRISSKGNKAKPAPDLFDTAEVQLESSKHGTARFVSDYQLLERRYRIGQSYSSLRYASDFCNLLIINGTHMADLPSLYHLAERSLDAFAERKMAAVVFIKSLYILLKDEGYPVRESWWLQLPVSLRSDTKTLIQEPTPDSMPDSMQHSCEQSIQHLLDWLRRETDLTLADYTN
ncbi:MAG: hypothetical protein AAF065_05990 [Verrucomicrobiota bacterium]